MLIPLGVRDPRKAKQTNKTQNLRASFASLSYEECYCSPNCPTIVHEKSVQLFYGDPNHLFQTLRAICDYDKLDFNAVLKISFPLKFKGISSQRRFWNILTGVELLLKLFMKMICFEGTW